jgi:SAM-dependent methyltransferase
MKQDLWNKEFAVGHWAHIENTANDCVYRFIERYCNNGSILDLGCGSGNTGVELNASKYRAYHGVDISDVALQMAQRRSEESGRGRQNRYSSGDIITYVPSGQYDAIVFRESLCYVPRPKIEAILQRYRHHLTPGGSFVVRLCDRAAYGDIIKCIENKFKVTEKFDEPGSSTVVVVFQ